MPDGWKPAASSRSIARLRQLRAKKGVSQSALAAALGRTQAWVSMVESGTQTINDEMVQAWLRALDASEEEAAELVPLQSGSDDYIGWDSIVIRGVDHAQDELRRMEASVRHFWTFDPVIVPGILQTPAYIEAAWHAKQLQTDIEELPAFIAARMARQQVLHDRSRRIEVVMTEAAVRLPIASEEVLAAQAAHIAQLAQLPNILIGVIPSATQLSRIPWNGWMAHDQQRVIIELMSGEVTTTSEDSLRLYREFFDYYVSVSVTGSEVVDFLWQLTREYKPL
jgi:transcriptional regulator with XRE-family HTH domain